MSLRKASKNQLSAQILPATGADGTSGAAGADRLLAPC